MGEPCHRIEDHHTVETLKQNWKLYMNLVQERQVRNMEEELPPYSELRNCSCRLLQLS